MGTLFRKPIVAIVLAVGLIGIVVFAVVGFKKTPVPTVVTKISEPIRTTIGQSVEGRDIVVYKYGTGDKKIFFVGGIHGGYEWNSVALAYQFIDYLNDNLDVIPNNITVAVIPDANPDAVFKVTGKEGRFTIADVVTDTKILESARFNFNNVDLNRNFDCKWQSKSTWKTKTVSAGTAPFSEPEAEALKKYIAENNPTAVIFWHSQSNAVYASQCEEGILPETLDIMNAYSKASGYQAVKTFDAYVTTGAAEDWLASVGIPAITVELSTHSAIDWDKNLAGIKAVVDYYGQKQ